MNRLTVVAHVLLLGACSSAPYGESTSTGYGATTASPYNNNVGNESASQHGGGAGPGNVPSNPSAPSGGY